MPIGVPLCAACGSEREPNQNYLLGLYGPSKGPPTAYHLQAAAKAACSLLRAIHLFRFALLYLLTFNLLFLLIAMRFASVKRVARFAEQFPGFVYI